jgi:hypothetical protein
MCNKHLATVCAAAAVLVFGPAALAAQTDRSGFEIGLQVPSAISNEFHTTDVGVGAHLAWRIGGWLGVEGEFNLIGAQPADSAATTRELTEIEARLATTYKARDCDGWGALLAPEWSVIHITGAEITKAEAGRTCKAPDTRIDSLTSDNLVVRAFGDAAVVTGRTTASAGGQTVVLRFTDVFVRREGKWLAVASQATRVAQ